MKYDWPFLMDKIRKENQKAWNPYKNVSPKEIEAARIEIRKTIGELEAQLKVMEGTGVGSLPGGAALIQSLQDQIAMLNSRLAATWVTDHRQDFEFLGDLSTGIRFHPPCRWLPEGSYEDYYDYSYKNGSNPLWKNPYKFIDFYSAKCEWFGTGFLEKEKDIKSSGDLWLLENWQYGVATSGGTATSDDVRWRSTTGRGTSRTAASRSNGTDHGKD
jgi:hypothetical protein